jgi:hypothetical protein
MVALAADKNVAHLGDSPTLHLLKLPVKANVRIFKGALVVVDAGFAAPGRTATGLIVAGRAERQFDNTGGAAGAITAEVRRGVFPFVNSSAGDAIAQADVGTVCYIVDDQTVAKTSGTNTRSIAGRVVSVSEGDSQVYVEIGSFNP